MKSLGVKTIDMTFFMEKNEQRRQARLVLCFCVLSSPFQSYKQVCSCAGCTWMLQGGLTTHPKGGGKNELNSHLLPINGEEFCSGGTLMDLAWTIP